MKTTSQHPGKWPTVAVVVPVYNEADTLSDCLSSLIALDYPGDHLEYLFIDNNSTDQSLAILQKENKCIRILQETTRGAGAARNRAIKSTQAKIIAFTDADCFVDPKWLKALVTPLLGDPDKTASGGRILSKVPCNYIERFGEKIHDHRKAIEKYKPPYLITMNMAVSRQSLLDVGLFDETLLRGQDSDLAFRLWKAGLRFSYVKEAVVFHHNQNSLSGLFAEGYKHGYWGVRLIRKHRHSTFRSRKKSLLGGSPRIYPLLHTFLANSLRGRALAKTELCDLIFRSGKKFGMVRSILSDKMGI